MDMRISTNSTMRTYEIQRTDRQAAPNRMSRAEERQDMVALSSHAKDFSKIKKALNDQPDIRADKVADIKSRIENGTYNVTGMDVANKLFG